MSAQHPFRGPLFLVISTGSYVINDTMMKLATVGLPPLAVFADPPPMVARRPLAVLPAPPPSVQYSPAVALPPMAPSSRIPRPLA